MSSVIVVFSNRKNGWLQMQVFLQDIATNGTNKLVTNLSVSPYNEKTNIYNLTPNEILLVRSIFHASENCINNKLPKGFTIEDVYADYSKPDKDKNQSLKHFYDQLLDNNKKAIALLIKDTKVPVFFNFSNIKSLFDDDRVVMEPELCQPVYSISFNETDITYQIKLSHKGKPIEILYKNRFINFLPTNPASFIVAKRMYTLDVCNFRQIEPFTLRNSTITIPKTILTQPNNFIIRTIKDFDVVAQGFTVENIDVVPSARLYLNRDLALLPNISVEFDYNGYKVLPNSEDSVFVSQKKTKDGQYHFTKMVRDKSLEDLKLEVLEELGLVENNSSFTTNKYLLVPKVASENEDAKSRLFDIVAWINFNYDMLQLHDFEIDLKIDDQSFFVGKYDISASLNESIDWFDLKAVITIGEFAYPFLRFKNHILNHILEFELPNNTIFIIPEEWFTRFFDLFFYSQESESELKLSKGLQHLYKQAFKNDASNFSSDVDLKQINEDSIMAPERLLAELRSYQKFGYQWMSNLQKYNLGGILADDMGLGKTIQVISLILSAFEAQNDVITNSEEPIIGTLDLFEASPETNSIFNNTEIAPFLIVVPTSLIFNWKSEIEKFAPSLKVYLYQEKNRLKGESINILNKYHVVLVSYGIMQSDIQELRNFKFNYVVLDESQFVKNPTSKRYLAVTQLQSNYRLAMSGTPIENTLADLWAQMNFVNPGLLKSLKSFRTRYINPIEKQSIRDTQSEEDKLFNIIDPFILRRTKEMVAKELPPISIQTLYCDMNEPQKKYYEKARAAIRTEYLSEINSSGFKNSSAAALKAITRLRQIANHPRLVDVDYTESSGKFDEVMVSLETIIDEKHNVLIFSQFARNLALFEEAAQQKGWNYAKLTGATRDREAEINKFVKDPECRIFFITTKSGGTGLNLIKADYVFMLDPWWNEAAESQAFNRAHRIGQDKNVFVYRFISTDSIEQKMATLQSRKTTTANKFIRPHEQFGTITEVDMDELLS